MLRSLLPAAFFVALLVPTRASASEQPTVPAAPSYHRHVSAIFSRLGCNGGTCHGAVQGQNGFRLSLFGADPGDDHARLLREMLGRRVDPMSPAESLLLKKATADTPHGGGVLMKRGGFEYEVLRRWIAAGAPTDSPAHVKELRVLPAEQVAQPEKDYQLRVVATFADDTREDVTPYCSFESQDTTVAAVDRSGRVMPRGVGDAALIVRYRAQPAMARVLVPRPGETKVNDTRANNFIDAQILGKLRRLNLPSAAPADDATFLRRLSLDVTGELPSSDEVREFLADTRLDKRSRKIDELLVRPGHAALWTMKFCDILKAADYGVYADALTLEADAPRFQAWVRARLEENTPYDQFVERILLATSREGRDLKTYAGELKEVMLGFGQGRPDLDIYSKRKTLDLYWQRRGAVGVGGAMQVAHAFLGLRLECAQCHRHPHDVWQQDDLLDFANFFTRVRRVGFEGQNEKRFPEAAKLFKALNDEGKALEADVKKRQPQAKQAEAEAQKFRAEINRLTNDIGRLERLPGKDEELAKARAELEAKKADLASREAVKREVDELSRRAKVMPEVARRLLQAEVVILPPGEVAKVVSPIGTRESKRLRLLGQTDYLSVEAGKDPREPVMAWMRRPDNPYFARAIVNRVWAHYFGRGIIDPPDNLSPFNAASHPELLKEMCEGFVASGYDLRWLLRAILHSRTYQQSSAAPVESASDRVNYAAFPIRRLSAEVLLDAIETATGAHEDFDVRYYPWPNRMKAVEVPYTPRKPFAAFMLETFGRPRRNAAVQCDCERENSVSILQVLALANHPQVWHKIKYQTGRVARLLKDEKDNTKRVEEMFLSVVSRLPTPEERAACVTFIKEAESEEKGLQGVLWSLMNTREFMLQR